MGCPKCKGLMSQKSYIRPSEVFRLGPDYFKAAPVGRYYIESVSTCDQCGHREVEWHYAQNAPHRRLGLATR